eukprot:762704-Hanusia_phi.AAC.1
MGSSPHPSQLQSDYSEIRRTSPRSSTDDVSISILHLDKDSFLRLPDWKQRALLSLNHSMRYIRDLQDKAGGSLDGSTI